MVLPNMRSTPALLLLLTLGACDCASGTAGTEDTGVRQDTTVRDAPPRDATFEEESVCDDGFDNDGDGRIDEGCGCTPGTRQQCYFGDPALAGIGGCLWGIQRCESDFEFDSEWGDCIGPGAPEEETCDRVDNNCDGTVDEGCSCRVGEIRDCYTGPDGTLGVGLCLNGFERCFDPGTGPAWSGCAGSVIPETEDCDGGDEDCDGRIDEGCSCRAGETRACYGASDETRGVGECRSGNQMCTGDAWGDCAGDVTPVAEVCDSGRDEDCDGDIDCDDSDCSCCTSFSESVAIEPPEAELFFIVDRSGSMNWAATGTTRSRWVELESAMSTVLPMVSETPMGLLTFPEMTGSDERLNCDVASGPDVPIGAGNAGPIQSRLGTAAPRAGDTPTPDAFATAQSYLRGRTTSRTPFVILATDGLPEPNCGATVPATVAAIQSLRTTTGIETFVIGFVGPDSSGDTSGIPALRDALNQFAVAGGRPRVGSRQYYEAVDGPELTTAVRSILGEATECRFAISTAPPAGAVVTQNGAVVPASGYTWTGRVLEFTGPYCARIREGLVTRIDVRVDC